MRQWIKLAEKFNLSVVNPYDDSIWYRGTNQPGVIAIGDGRNGDMLGPGFYLTNNQEYAAKFGPRVEEFQLSLGAVLDEQDAPKKDGRMMGGVELNRYARENGFHAIIAWIGGGVYQLCVFDPSMVYPVEE